MEDVRQNRDSDGEGVKYRPARPEDCDIIAEYMCQTAGGILDYLYDGLTGDCSIAQSVSRFLRLEERYDSFKSVVVAEYCGQVIGMISDYPAHYHGVDEEMRRFFPAERLSFLAPYFDARLENSYYLSSIFVGEEFRGSGVAGRLIEMTKQKGRDLGYQQLSVLVMADNLVARKAYMKQGFSDVRHVSLQGNSWISCNEGLYLMASDIKNN